MPPLNEGTILYMPTAVPGMSITEATRILQIQDRMLHKIPEVATRLRQGRPGRDAHRSRAAVDVRDGGARSSRTTNGGPGMTWEKLIAEMNANIKTPGMANIFWMPIQTRTEMLTTGFRSVLGVKVFGPDLKQIEKSAVQIEKALSDFPNTRSVFAERTTGGYFLDFDVNREAAARYGLRVGDVNDVDRDGDRRQDDRHHGGRARALPDQRPLRARFPARTWTRSSGCWWPRPRCRPAIPRPASRAQMPQIPISLLAEPHYKTGPALHSQ